MLRSKIMLSASVAAILSLAAAALPAAAQDQSAPAATPPAGAPSTTAAPPAANAPSKAGPGHHGYRRQTAEAVEARITRLQKQLQITPEQEQQWSAVADTMRENAKNTAEMVRQAEKSEATMTAVDDLKSYAQIAQAHAQGVQKLADAFSTLYSSMSDSQKKVADQVFRHHRRHPRHRKS